MVDKMIQINESVEKLIDFLKSNKGLEGLVPQFIDIDSLHPTQSSLIFSKIDRIQGDIDCLKYSPILVIKCPNKKYYIEDGHHRAYLAKNQNKEKIFALVYDADCERYKNNYSLLNMRIVDDSRKFNGPNIEIKDDGLDMLFGK